MIKDNYLLTEAANIDSATLSKYVESTWVHQTALSVVDFFDWQLKHYPGGNGVNRSLVITDKKTDDIYGFFGIIPKPFILNGNILKGAELTTWIISEELRGMSFAYGMLDYLINNYDFICAVGGVSPPAMYVYKQTGFKYVKSLPRFYKIYNIERTKGISKISDLGFKLQNNVNFTVSSVSNVEEFNHQTQYKNFYKNLNCYSRSKQYLQWRYINHPFFKYKVFIVNSGSEKEVVLVLRIQELESICLCHVIDFYGYEDGFQDALSFIDYYCVNNSVDFADFYCLSSFITKHFWTNGWFSVLDDPEIAIPHLFNPIDLRNPPTASVIMYAPKHVTEICDINRLYITKGDGDLDKPTITYLQKDNLI
ncbi:hypothetical protein ACFLUZ_04040 [Chloroflexota bacterium]